MMTMAHRSDLNEQSLVRPVISANTPRLGPFAVIAGVEPDLRMIAKTAAGAGVTGRALYQGRLFAGVGPANGSLAGPVLGAPQAVMLLENMLAWGARSVLFFGWCGALSEDLAIGDVLMADGAFCDEGTSPHYGAEPGQPVTGAALTAVPAHLRTGLEQAGVPVHTGKVWTTDAIFRETPSRVATFRALGAVAVDMETSALMSTAAYRGAGICCVLVVSDALRGDSWEKGFRDPAFKAHRGVLCRLIAEHLMMVDDG